MSTDNSHLLSNKTSVTSDMLYNLKASAGNTTSHRINVPSSNKSIFNCGDVMIFSVPCSKRNSYLDGQNSYLKFCVQNNDTTNAFNLDHSGYCFINQLTIFNSGNLVEQISNYNVLVNTLIDYQFNQSSSLGLSPIIGTSPDIYENVINDDGTGTAIAAWPTGLGSSVGQVKGSLNSCRRGNYVKKSGGRLSVCLPIVSNLFTLSDKMIPVSRLNSDIELQFLLENLTQSVAATALTTPWTIISSELVLNYVVLSDTAEEIVRSVSPIDQAVFIHSSSYRSYPQTLANGSTGNQNFLISSRFNSLKSIFLMSRRSTEINSQNAYSLSSRINPNIQQFYWTIGSNIVPSKFVQLYNVNQNGSYAECYSELLKAFHAYGDLSFGGVVGFSAYNVVDDTNGVPLENVLPANTGMNSYKNGFCAAVELECYSTRNDTILGGVNTISQNVFFNSLHSGTALSAAYTMNFFAYFDCILVIDQGVMKCLF